MTLPPSRPTADAPATPATQKLLPWPVRWLLLVFAVLSLVTGVIGIFVPGLPTTVFVLMAAWAAARSSPRLHGWLARHRIFGPMITDWANGGTVRRSVKWRASLMMALCAVIVGFTAHRVWTAALAIGCMVCVSAWLWRRPEPPQGDAVPRAAGTGDAPLP